MWSVYAGERRYPIRGGTKQSETNDKNIMDDDEGRQRNDSI